MYASSHSASQSQQVNRSIQENENTVSKGVQLPAVVPVQMKEEEEALKEPVEERPQLPNETWQATQRKQLRMQPVSAITQMKKDNNPGSYRNDVIQMKGLTVFIQGLSKNKTLRIEVEENGDIEGSELQEILISAIVGMIPTWAGKEKYIILKKGTARVNVEQTYQLNGNETFNFNFDQQKHDYDQRSTGAPDNHLIDLAASSDACSIGCYLLSSPGKKEALQEQQELDAVLAAIDAKRQFKLTLIDPNFRGSHDGQIVDYLIKEKGISPTMQQNGVVTTYSFGRVTINYVAVFTNKATEEIMKERGIGQWYSEEK